MVTYGLLLDVDTASSYCGGIGGDSDTDSNAFAMRNNTNDGPRIPLQLSYHDTSILPTRVVRGYDVRTSKHHTIHQCGATYCAYLWGHPTHQSGSILLDGDSHFISKKKILKLIM